MKKTKLVTLYSACLLSFMPLVAAAQPYLISKNGAEVTDKKTGLIWRRCAEGMRWSGKTCVGQASTYTHAAALQLAKNQTTNTGVAWRLPNKDELVSIVDYDRRPAINSKVFPATPAQPFWVDAPAFVWPNAPEMGDSLYAWFVNFDDGYVHQKNDLGDSYHVRLVRSGS